MNRFYSDFYIPRTKAGLLNILLPTWKGKKTDLRQMTTKRLKAIFITTREKQLRELMKK